MAAVLTAASGVPSFPRMASRRRLPRGARERATTVVERLAAEYPDAACALVHDGPLQLLVATILSAQCTDERVNLVTPGLFRPLSGRGRPRRVRTPPSWRS